MTAGTTDRTALLYLLTPISDDVRTDLMCVYPLTGDLKVSEATPEGTYKPVRILKQDFCKVC